jgi:hypothetical protein
MELDTLLNLPGVQAAIICFCILCLVLIFCCCLYKFTSVKRTRKSYKTWSRKRRPHLAKIVPSNTNTTGNDTTRGSMSSPTPSNNSKSSNYMKKKKVLRKKLSFSKQLSVSDRNLKRIKHEYASNGARFDRKSNLIKTESLLKAKQKKQLRQLRRKDREKAKLLPISNSLENNNVDSSNTHSNFVPKQLNDIKDRRGSTIAHGITNEFRCDTADYNHEIEMIKNKQAENTTKKLQERRLNSDSIGTSSINA